MSRPSKTYVGLFTPETGRSGFAPYSPVSTASYASSEWVWGGAAQIGLAYYLDDGWFLDVNYTYARSAEFSSHYSSHFMNATGGYDTDGTLFIDPSQRVTNQSVSITINKGF